MLHDSQLWTQLRDTPTILRQLVRRYSSLQIAMVSFSSLRMLVMALSAAAYVLSPLDLVPEAIFGVFGLIDDVLIAALAALSVAALARTQILNAIQRGTGMEQLSAAVAAATAAARDYSQRSAPR